MSTLKEYAPRGWALSKEAIWGYAEGTIASHDLIGLAVGRFKKDWDHRTLTFLGGLAYHSAISDRAPGFYNPSNSPTYTGAKIVAFGLGLLEFSLRSQLTYTILLNLALSFCVNSARLIDKNSKKSQDDIPGQVRVVQSPQSSLEVLGLGPGAEWSDIRKSYIQLVKKYHPDRNRGSQKAAAKFREVQSAYVFLEDSYKQKR